MNSLCDHEEYVRLNPHDKTAALALVDHHQEALDVPRLLALKAVARIRRLAVSHRELIKATRLMQHDKPSRARLMWVVREATWTGMVPTPTILVIPGRRRPKYHLPQRGRDATDHWGGTITVGARYLLRIWKGLKRIDRLPEEEQVEALDRLIDS